MRALRRLLRHLLAIPIAGVAAHGALIGLITLGGLGGAYSAFAVGAIQTGAMVAFGLRVAPDGIAQLAWLAFGPFLAPFLPAVAVVAVATFLFGARAPMAHVFGTAALSALPLLLRVGEVNPGAPTIAWIDVALVFICGAIGGAVHWLVAGVGVRRR